MNRFVKKYIFIAILLINVNFIFGQSGTLTGKILNESDKPIELVNVLIKNTTLGTITDKDGKFLIQNIKPGGYEVEFSFVGFETQMRAFEIFDSENITIPAIILKEKAKELEAILVQGYKPIDLNSEYVSKIELKSLENAQVYNVVNSDLLKLQNIKNFDYALNNVPGIYKLWESTGRGYGDGAAYYSLRGFESQATVVNGVPGLTNGSLDPANIERIEVIKGPSGTLFGSSLISYGGLINTVTKKPYDKFGGEVSYTSGSFGLNRITADVNIPLNNTKDALLRINSSYHSEKSFQDAGFRKSIFVAPTLSMKLSDKLSLLVNAEILLSEGTNPVMLFLNRSSQVEYKDLSELNYNNKLSLTSNDLTIKNPRYNLQAFATYKLSDEWKSQTILSSGISESEGYYSYLWDDEITTNQFGLYISDQNAYTTTIDLQQNFTGEFYLGEMKNRLLIGFDYFNRKITDGSTGYGFVHNVTPQGDINYVDPYTGDTLPPYYLSRQSIDQLLSGYPRNNSNVSDMSTSVYISDVANIFQSLIVMASLRIDYFNSEGDIYSEEDDFKQTALSPKFGLVYQPVLDKISLFANYQNGFKNVAPQQVADPDGSNPRTKTFKPERANQFEVGIKTSLLSDRIFSTLSYYNINVKEVVISDPQNIYNSVQGGEVQSKGIEFEINANLIGGFNLITGYSYNDSKIIQGDPDGIWFQEGKRPVSAGPQNLFNLWATYEFQKGILDGFGLGFGVNGSSELIVIDSDVTGKFTLPSYTIFNSSVFYKLNNIFLTFNLNNVSDTEYYKGYSTINPQEPRNYSLTMALKF